jgi:hypothetical protein
MTQENSNDNTLPMYLTEKGAGDLIGIAAETMRKWRNAGTGPRYKRFGRASVHMKPRALS